MTAEPRLNCEVVLPEPPVAGPASPLNVGDIWNLRCQSDQVKTFSENAQIVFADEKDKLNLKILKVRDLEFDVVSYRAGEFKDQTFLISDGVTTARVAPISWKIESVLTPDSQPFPPFSGERMSYPLWYWLAFLLSLVVVSLWVYSIFRRRKTRRQLITSVLGAEFEGQSFREIIKIQNKQAYLQLSRDLRQIQKDLNAFKPKEPQLIWNELEKSYRLFLVRELLTPAMSWSTKAILKDIRRHHPRVFKACQKGLHKTLTEFERGQGQSCTLKDCEQVLMLVRESSDQIYAVRSKK